MPKLDGYGVLHLLSKDDRTAGIPFIFVTAKSERNDLRKGMEMGADDYLSKPFEDTELYSAVEARLKKSSHKKNNTVQQPDKFRQFIEQAGKHIKLKTLTEGLESDIFKTRDIIFRSGDFPHFIYFIDRGKVKTFRTNEDGKEFIVNLYKSGDFFGYQAIFEDRAYMKNAEALEKSHIYKIPKDQFLGLINKNQEVAAKLIQVISKTLTEKEAELVHIAYDSVRKRVALKLLEIVPDSDDNVASISRTDFAAIIGTSTETLVRTLTELKNLKIISTDGQDITLLDKKKLSELSKSW
jgi:CRP-like cAMP-binding protein